MIVAVDCREGGGRERGREREGKREMGKRVMIVVHVWYLSEDER